MSVTYLIDEDTGGKGQSTRNKQTFDGDRQKV